MNKIQVMMNILTEAAVDYDKFLNGNNAAGARVRKFMQETKVKAQDIRVEISTIKKERA